MSFNMSISLFAMNRLKSLRRRCKRKLDSEKKYNTGYSQAVNVLFAGDVIPAVIKDHRSFIDFCRKIAGWPSLPNEPSLEQNGIKINSNNTPAFNNPD